MMTEKYNLGKTDFASWNTAMAELAKAKYTMSNTTYIVILREKLLNVLMNIPQH